MTEFPMPSDVNPLEPINNGFLPQQPAVSPAQAEEIFSKRTAPDNVYDPKNPPAQETEEEPADPNAPPWSQQAALASAGVAPVVAGAPSIVEQARALRHNVDLIYQFVHDQIDFIPNYGLHKGGFGALIDGQANAFDQTDLMVQLLRESGYTANYVLGVIRLTESQWSNWLGVNQSDVTEAANLLANGGIPVEIVSGTTDIRLNHYWVKVDIGGTDYVFDPTFKQYTNIAGEDIETILDYDRTTFLSDANNGSTLTADYVQDINEANIVSSLTEYSSNLVDWITANNSGITMSELLGGREIVGTTGTLRQTDLPYRDTAYGTVTTSSVPTNLRATLRFQYDFNSSTGLYRIDQTFYSADIYGQRLTLWFDGSLIAKLRLNGTVVGTSAAQSSGTTSNAIVTITHPYPTTFADTTQAVAIGAGAQTSIGTAWGFCSKEMAAYHQEAQNQAIADGISSGDERLLGLSLLLIWDNFIGQVSYSGDLASRIGNTRTVVHHMMTTISQAPHGAGKIKTTSFFVLGANTSALDSSGDPDARVAATNASLALCWLMLQQPTTPQVTGVANTTSLLAIQQANAASTKIYDAKSSNWTSGANVKSLMITAGYSTAILTSIENQFITVSPSWRVAMPENGNMSFGSFSGLYGYIAMQPYVVDPGPPEVFGYGNVLFSQFGFTSSGSTSYHSPAAVTSALQSDADTNSTSSDNARQVNGFGLPTATGTESARVNMLKGRYEYSSLDLTVGNQGYPYELSFIRSYNSALRLTFQGLGFGWSHNWQMKASENSDGFIPFGDQRVSAAAPAIAALYVCRDVALSDSSMPINNFVINCLIQEFVAAQLFKNTVRLDAAGSTVVFTKMPHPSGDYYLPQLGVHGAAKLEKLGSGGSAYFKYTTPDQIVFTYRTDGNIDGIAYPFGIGITFTYSSNRLTKVSNGFRELNFTYDGYGQLSTVNDGTTPTRAVTLSIDPVGLTGNLTAVADPLNKSTTYEYDQRGRLTKVFKPANPTAPVITNVYDTLSRIKQQKDSYDNTWDVYLAGSRSEEVAPNNTSRIAYFNARGSALRSINALDQEVLCEYDGLERCIKVTLPEGNSTETTYDANSNIIAQTRHPKPSATPPASTTTTFTYDTMWNKVKTITDPDGNVTTYTYSTPLPPPLPIATGLSLVIKIEGPTVAAGTPITTFTYNFAGQLLTATDPTGVVISNTYEATKNNLTSTAVDPSGLNITTSFTYDSIGNVLTVTDPKGHVSTAVYNKNRRMTQVTGPAPFNQVSYLTYDDNGNVIQSQSLDTTDPNCQTVTATYTLDGKVSTMTGPPNYAQGSQPVPVRYFYDSLRRIEKVIDSSGNIGVTTYDELSRPISVSIDGETVQTMTYTDNGLMESITDAKSNTTEFEYDDFDRAERTTYPDSSFESVSYDDRDNVITAITRAGTDISFSYDALNRLVTKSPDGQPTVTYSEDLAGRLVSVSTPVVSGDPSTGTFSFAYDSVGRMTSEEYPDAKTVTATLDANGNVEALEYPDGADVTQAFDALDRVTSISGFSGSTTFGYDSASRRSSQTFGNNTAHGYRYDKADNLLALTIGRLQPGGTPTVPSQVTFSYHRSDITQEVTRRCNDSNFLWKPTLMSTTTYGTANTLNQYPSVNSASYSYNTDGCLTSDSVTTYGYDYENKLTSVTKGGTTFNFKYDPLGRLTQKTMGATVKRFLYSGLRRIEEYDGSGNLLRRYVYGTGMDECLFAVDQGTSAITYLHGDEAGSIILQTNSAGLVKERNVYTPWGDLISGSLSDIPIGYTGQFFESESDLYFYKARHYSQTLGRFLQPDPIGYAGGLNLYDYCGGDPVNFTDPLGLLTLNVGVQTNVQLKQPIVYIGPVPNPSALYANWAGAPYAYDSWGRMVQVPTVQQATSPAAAPAVSQGPTLEERLIAIALQQQIAATAAILAEYQRRARMVAQYQAQSVESAATRATADVYVLTDPIGAFHSHLGHQAILIGSPDTGGFFYHSKAMKGFHKVRKWDYGSLSEAAQALTQYKRYNRFTVSSSDARRMEQLALSEISRPYDPFWLNCVGFDLTLLRAGGITVKNRVINLPNPTYRKLLLVSPESGVWPPAASPEMVP